MRDSTRVTNPATAQSLWPLFVAISSAVLVPYLTRALPQDQSLLVQAGLISLMTVPALIVLFRSKGRLRRPPRLLAFGWLAYVAWIASSALVGIYLGNPPRYVMGQLFTMAQWPLFAFLVYVWGLRTEGWVRLVWVLLCIVSIIAVAEIFGIALRESHVTPRLLDPRGDIRINAVVLGLLLLPYIVTSPESIATHRRSKVALYSMSALLVAALWFGMTVSFLLGTLVASAAMITLLAAHRRLRLAGFVRVATVMGLAFVVLGLTELASTGVNSRILSYYTYRATDVDDIVPGVTATQPPSVAPTGATVTVPETSSETAQSRLTEASVLLPLALAHQPFGLGLGATFTAVVLDNQGNFRLQTLNFIHNFYLLLFAKTGVVGLAIFLAWTLALLESVLVSRKLDLARAGGFAVLVAFLVLNWFSPQFADARAGILVGLATAVIAGAVSTDS